MHGMYGSHESGGGSIDDLIRRMPTTRDEHEIVAWLVELFAMWNGGHDGRVLILRGDIAQRMAQSYGFQPGATVVEVPPEGHTMRGRWLIQLAINTLAGTGYDGSQLERDCRVFLEHARAWMLEV